MKKIDNFKLEHFDNGISVYQSDNFYKFTQDAILLAIMLCALPIGYLVPFCQLTIACLNKPEFSYSQSYKWLQPRLYNGLDALVCMICKLMRVHACLDLFLVIEECLMGAVVVVLVLNLLCPYPWSDFWWQAHSIL